MDAATIAETNRIRVSLGMKPLPVPGAEPDSSADSSGSDSEDEPASTVETRQAEAYDNYNKIKDAEAAKKKRQERATAIRKARENAQRFSVMEGKGLGEEDKNGDVDAKSWLMGQKKRQKKIEKARKMEEELAAAEAAAAAAVQYTSKDLAGVKIGHDMTSFLDGDNQVLTLKDTTIDENEEEGDELENLNMREQELLTDRMDLKKKLHGYDPNDDDGQGGILAQYDDEISGKKTKRFTLGADGSFGDLSDILDQPVRQTNKLQNVSLDDIIEDAPLSSDYLAPSEIKIKKPKKKKSKGTRQKQHDEDDIFPIEPPAVDNSSMDVDVKDGPVAKKRKVQTDDFVDDDDLQASLAIQRKNALKKRKKTRPEDIAKQVREQEDEPAQGDQENGLVIGEISEFVASLSVPEEPEVRRPKRTKTPTTAPEDDENQEDQDHPMGDIDHYDADAVAAAEAEDEAAAGHGDFDEEKVVGEGMGAALALLRERGLVKESKSGDQYESFRAREEFLSKKRTLDLELDEQARQQRERDRMSGKLDRMSTREREEWARQQNTWRDQQQARKVAELFQAKYKPTVELKYTDDQGRSLDQKEAFKHLSHQFHGKGSGKGKTEKRLKKVEDEKRRDAQSMFDASQNSGMNLAAAQQLKKRKEAGVRLG